MRRILALTILGALPHVANAEPWLSPHNIRLLYPSTSGYVFAIDYSYPEYSSCDNGGRFLISIDHPNYEAMVSTLIAAYLSGDRITLNVDSEGLSGPVCGPTVNRFMVYE